MDAATINQKIYSGRAKAALRLGFDYAIYRPLAANAPLANLITTIKAAFNAGDNAYTKPNMPGDAYWYGDFDGRQTLPGDYMVHATNPQDVKYIAAQQSLLPILCVDCNRSIKILRQEAATTYGALDYGGQTPSTMIDVLGTDGALWPASILRGGRAIQSDALPAGVTNTGWRILLPSSVPIVILAGDIIADDLTTRYVVDSAELSDTGWRLSCSEVHT